MIQGWLKFGLRFLDFVLKICYVFVLALNAYMDLGSEMFRFNMVSGAILEGKIGANLVQTSIEELMDFLLGVLGV